MNTQNVDAFVERFNQDDGGFPESWKPTPGSEIIGTVVRYDQAESKKFDGKRVIAVLECLNAGGKPYLCAVWLGHEVLKNEFARKRPKPGERVAIKRLDDVKGKRGTYAKYVLHVDRPLTTLEPNWEAFGATSTGTLPTPSSVTQAAPKAKDEGEDDAIPF